MYRLARLNPVQLRHAVRTAAAAVVTYALTELFALEEGYWAVISTIIVMHSTLGRAVAAGWARILGTAVGAALGAVSVLAFGDTHLSLGVAVFATMLVCAYLTALHEAFRIAGLTAAIVIFVGAESADIIRTALERFIEIALGVTVAMGFSMTLWPSRASHGLLRGLAADLHMTRRLFGRLLDDCMTGSYDATAVATLKQALHEQQVANQTLLAESRKEPARPSARRQAMASLVEWEERLFEDLLAMDHAARELATESLHRQVERPLRNLGAAVEHALAALAARLEALHASPGARVSAASTARGVWFAQEKDALRVALHELDRAMAGLRQAKTSAAFTLQEVSHFFSLIFAMRETAGECFRGFDLMEDRLASSGPTRVEEDSTPHAMSLHSISGLDARPTVASSHKNRVTPLAGDAHNGRGDGEAPPP